MEPRCFDCRCSMCELSDNCTEKGCYGDEQRNSFTCDDVVIGLCPLADPEAFEYDD